ncbi:hypothetical protein SBA3_4540003 [Candidatus Sulfopaludibacter sp. SbA3]|nr:hypothetical protein SBA3_4540003 [Candidatus Sulfopaludibacter sp. SbA3]
MKKYLNLSMQKNILPFGRDSKKRFQFRIDAINVLNHPNFVFNNDVSGASYRVSKLPSQSSLATLATTEYNTWAQYNNQPLYTTTAGAALYNRLDQAWDTRFGTLSTTGEQPRMVQFSARLTF